MAVFQIGQQAIKPTAIGEISRGLQAYQSGQQQMQQQKMQQAMAKMALEQLRRQMERSRQFQVPSGLQPSRATIGPAGGVTQTFEPPIPEKLPTPAEKQTKEFNALIDSAFTAGLMDLPTFLALKSGAKGQFPTAPGERAKTKAETAKIEKETEEIGKAKPLTPEQRAKVVAETNKMEAQAEQLAAVSKFLKGTSLGEFEPTFGPSGVTLRPKPKPAAGERKAIAETESSLDMMSNLRSLFNSPDTQTGPIVGRISPTAGLIGKTTQAQENLMAATAAFKNRIIKEITGAQMSEAEANRIMKQVPDITDPPARWKAKWNQTVKNLKIIQKRRKEVLKESGVRISQKDIFTIGEIRTDNQGNKRKYIGSGQWQLVK